MFLFGVRKPVLLFYTIETYRPNFISVICDYDYARLIGKHAHGPPRRSGSDLDRLATLRTAQLCGLDLLFHYSHLPDIPNGTYVYKTTIHVISVHKQNFNFITFITKCIVYFFLQQGNSILIYFRY